MPAHEEINRPSKDEQKTAMESYDPLKSVVEQIRSDSPEIEIAETGEKIKIPLSALKFLTKIVEEISKGNPVSILPIAAEMTTQAAADYLGCSRPHLVKLLEDGEIPYTKVGKHRRVKLEDVVEYKKQMKANQKAALIEMMHADEDLGLYDS